MEYSKEKLAALLNKQQWTVEDYKWLAQYIETTSSEELEQLMHEQYIEDLFDTKNSELDFSADLLKKIHNRIDETGNNHHHRFKVKRWMAVAASVTGLFLFACLFYLNHNRMGNQNAIVSIKKNDVAPGKNKAILKLSDGSSVTLGDAESRHIAHEGNTDIMEEGARLSYNKEQENGRHQNEPKNLAVANNTLSTPRGGQFQLKLADGTLVWLNSASSLQFPAVFNGKERKVKLTGEAYFEVAKNKKMPFIVEVADSKIEVLGTHFNIKAYNDDETASLKATLLEGSIRFSCKNKVVTLQPGEQAELAANGTLLLNKNVNTDDILAWKNGLFHFEAQRLESIMHDLARWYDIDVVYKDRINTLFFAEMPKNTNLSDALRALQLAGKIKFTIEGRKVIVSKS